MSECVNPEFGAMLHAWELGMLSEEERQRFEMHLLQCEACADEARQFLQAAKLLREDPEFRPKADIPVEDRMSHRSEKASIRRQITRVLLAAAAILVVAIPVYRWTFAPSDEPVMIQYLNLVPLRSGAENAIDSKLGGQVEIRFYADGSAPDSIYRITVTSDNARIAYSDSHFTGFTTSGVGTILLSVSKFEAGIYRLTAVPASDSLSPRKQTYYFRVE